MPKPSKIFTGYRALGFVSNHVPLSIHHHVKHKENYVVTCIGRAFHTYNSSKLGIISVSNRHPEDIECLTVDAQYIFTAFSNTIKAFRRKGREEYHTYSGHEADVHLLLPFGKHLISVDRKSVVNVWDIEAEEVYLELPFDASSFEVSAVLHPSTYLNKLLFASRQGAMQLWNVKTNKLVYTFSGWGSPITCLEQAPAVDVVAIGLEDGRIMLHNLKYDETVMSFQQDWGPVTTLAFRADGNPVLCSGSPLGHIAQWDLQERKLQSQIRDAHRGAITGMQCLPGEPLMVTSSPDNSLRVWIFDMPDGGGRLLRERSGHSAPPSQVSYHGTNGHNVLTAGQDSTLRSFSTQHDRLNKSLGRASYDKKKSKRMGLKKDTLMMPPVVQFASEHSRQSDWDTIVACHRSEAPATTWNYTRSTMGSHRLLHDRFKDSKRYHNACATCCDISSCGNFAVIGYSTGHVDTFNMQSGLHRGSYGDPAHKGSVRGVVIDGLNQVTVTAGADCVVRFWRFKSKQLLGSVKLDAQIAHIVLHRDSGMLAVSLDNFLVIIIDIETRKQVRVFRGHSNRITHMTFRADGRWLVTASMDSTIRTWDLPTGRLLDCFLMDSAVTSLALSPTSDFLATTHVDDLGVYLWSNMTLYEHVSLRPLPADYEPQLIDMPGTSRISSGLRDSDDEEMEEFMTSEFQSPEQISDQLVTMSALPNSRWLNLLNLDVIKERNKPKAPPKVPKKAPFFLPTIAGLEPKFDVPKEEQTKEEKRSLSAFSIPLSAFGQSLVKCAEVQHYEEALAIMKEMGPSAVDTEIRCLAPTGGGSFILCCHFLDFIDSTLKTNQDFELAQAYLGLFLKRHGEELSTDKDVVEKLRSVQKSQVGAWHHLQHQFNQSLCLVNYLRSAVLS